MKEVLRMLNMPAKLTEESCLILVIFHMVRLEEDRKASLDLTTRKFLYTCFDQDDDWKICRSTRNTRMSFGMALWPYESFKIVC